MVTIALLAHSAHAQTAVDFVEDFEAYSQPLFSGTAGWESGYALDPWGAAVGGTVYPLNDDSPCTPYGTGGCLDEHLVYTLEAWSDFTLDFSFSNADDDALGAVFRYQDAANYYVAYFTRASNPGPGIGDVEVLLPNSRMYRVEAGIATEIAVTGFTYTQNLLVDARVVATGPVLEVWLDVDDSGAYDPGELILSAVDATFVSGLAGFFAYNNGDALGLAGAFEHFTISLTDGDADGFPDATLGGSDCADADAAVHPDALELTADGVDQDCSGTESCWADGDGDGHAGSGAVQSADLTCTSPGTGTAPDDCDDGSAEAFPGATELPNGLDDDCDGVADQGIDADGDGLDAPAEILHETDPDDPDTDGDGVSDGDEVAAGTDPLTAEGTADTGSPGVPSTGDRQPPATVGPLPAGCDCDSTGHPPPLTWAALAAWALRRRGTAGQTR